MKKVITPCSPPPETIDLLCLKNDDVVGYLSNVNAIEGKPKTKAFMLAAFAGSNTHKIVFINTRDARYFVQTDSFSMKDAVEFILEKHSVGFAPEFFKFDSMEEALKFAMEHQAARR